MRKSGMKTGFHAAFPHVLGKWYSVRLLYSAHESVENVLVF